jgi:hypothetical protein
MDDEEVLNVNYISPSATIALPHLDSGLFEGYPRIERGPSKAKRSIGG